MTEEQKDVEILIGIRNNISVLDVKEQEKLTCIAYWKLPKEELLDFINVLKTAADAYGLKKAEEVLEKCPDLEENPQKD